MSQMKVPFPISQCKSHLVPHSPWWSLPQKTQPRIPTEDCACPSHMGLSAAETVTITNCSFREHQASVSPLNYWVPIYYTCWQEEKYFITALLGGHFYYPWWQQASILPLHYRVALSTTFGGNMPVFYHCIIGWRCQLPLVATCQCFTLALVGSSCLPCSGCATSSKLYFSLTSL